MLPRNIRTASFSAGDDLDCPITGERSSHSHPQGFPQNKTSGHISKNVSGLPLSITENSLIGNANHSLRRVVSNSESTPHRKEDGIRQNTVKDAKFLPKKRQWGPHIPPVGNIDMAEAYIAQRECYEQQKLIAADRLKVQRLRAMMWEQREEETALRNSIRSHLSDITCCHCQSTAELIEKDYAALRSIAHYYLDLEYQYNQSEDDLEELEHELTRSAARLSRLFHPVDDRKPQGVRTDRRVARPSFHSRSFDSQLVPLTTSERKDSQQQPQPVTSQVQESILLDDAEKDSDSFSQRSTRSVSPDHSSRRDWDKTEARPRYDIADFESDLDEIAQSAPGSPRDAARLLGVRSHSAPDLVKDPFKLESYEKSSPFEQNDFESPESPFQRRKFIDNWILHQVRTSSLESARLRSQPEWETLRSQGLTEEEISQLALECWHSHDPGAVVSSGSTIKPSRRSEQASTVIWRGTCRSFNHRKRTNSMAFGARPQLRRMSRYDSAWREFGPDDEGSQPGDVAKENE
ncbi:hypothetical protein BDQ94DRAFT_77993 [Aspergillus welwitschiae]|uniref:Uncharacterized protein n=1 Tax=Aspergillus welwitschiae TaxID=1341132 RepID=A0A3F3PTL9_9EURO|nr:hypothetical protein BDQ94DRAFT_77993 [Aspergillus welwitschiae]RDH30269.1 hypothetical protein BDQ94DRAFT_77993 [Aspergillus welwitschiae]